MSYVGQWSGVRVDVALHPCSQTEIGEQKPGARCGLDHYYRSEMRFGSIQ